MLTNNLTFFSNSNFEEIKFASPIPKIIHRIWMVFNPDSPSIPEKYIEYDKILKSLHPNWYFWEWDDAKILNFIHEYYQDFFITYISYPTPIMRHDVARYLILKQFGGVFIQHSFIFNKAIDPLLKNYDLVFTNKFNSSDPIFKNRKEEVANGIIASTPDHPFWQNITNKLKAAIAPVPPEINFVMAHTGPIFLTRLINEYIKQNPINNRPLSKLACAEEFEGGSEHRTGMYKKKYMRILSTEPTCKLPAEVEFRKRSIKILDYKYLIPFYSYEKKNTTISEHCITPDSPLDCFKIFDQAFAYTTWNADWLKKDFTTQIVNLSQLNSTRIRPLYDRLFVVNLNRSPDRWKRIAKTLYDNKIKFHRFPAVDGYNVLITLPDNKTVIRGIDIKHNAYKLEKNVEYKVLCDNKIHPAVTIYLQSDFANLMAANIGTCCTKVLIREEIIRNHYNNTIIFEDDFEPNTDNLLSNINDFILNIPKYDIAYLNNGSTQKAKFKIYNNFTLTHGNATKWYGDWAYMLSYEGAKKLNGDYHLINPSDEYSRRLALGEIKKEGIESFVPYFAKHNFSLLHYSNFTGHNKNSLASSMGCRESHPLSYKYCNQTISLDQSFVINANEAYLNEISQEFFKQNLTLSNFNTELSIKIKPKNPADYEPSILKVVQEYIIECDSNKLNPFEFTYRGNIENQLDLENWCNHLMLLNYIKYKEYNSAIFANDYRLQPNSNHILTNFIANISSSFDILFLDPDLTSANCRNQASNFFISLKAVDKILSLPEYKMDVINFYCDIYEQNYLNNEGSHIEFELYQLGEY